MSWDEGPSPEDIRRFDHDSAYCPECGAEIYDEAPACSECGAWIQGTTLGRSKISHEAHGRLRTIVVVLVLIGFLAAIGLLRVFF